MGKDFLLQVYVQMEGYYYILKDLKQKHYYFVYDRFACISFTGYYLKDVTELLESFVHKMKM